MIEIIGIWVAAFLTLCIYSFLYRDNPFYRFAEHLFVGISVGYGIVIAMHQGIIPLAWVPLSEAMSALWTVITGQATPETINALWGLVKIIPIAIGLLFFARLSPRHTWLIRYPIAILIGFGAGIAIPNELQANIFAQTRGTIAPFAAINAGTLSAWDIFGTILIVIGVICTLIYFFFSMEHRGAISWLSKVGIAFLMVGFGAAFGNTVMGRLALMIHRVGFLIKDWLGTIF
ncbi:hypothetical protein F4009_16315 [Candidatus Poribacteria bacterium]|nr:hypothetical protein [Candidatus Poribacteria bacterium]MYA70227.1 hypothetical protein [Candidatus Poribacteria bacterium]MYH83671.1 hypothetical protein [Candidatus Poribacteria bacterium]MYK95535.1 hypothetical protein [Candidatus Poribacteria bacterium]